MMGRQHNFHKFKRLLYSAILVVELSFSLQALDKMYMGWGDLVNSRACIHSPHWYYICQQASKLYFSRGTLILQKSNFGSTLLLVLFFATPYISNESQANYFFTYQVSSSICLYALFKYGKK